MKKQIFLLTSLLIAGANLVADSCCPTKTVCKTSCKPKSCKDVCVPAHGKTFRRVENAFQNATPVYASLFNSNVVRNLDAEDKHGGMEITVFGGKNSKKAEAACYFFPYGHSKYTFDGSVKSKPLVTALAFNQADLAVTATANGALAAEADYALVEGNRALFSTNSSNDATLNTDTITVKFDANKDTSKILPWNFGITFAALFEPTAASATGALGGSGLVTSPEFNSTISPTYEFSHIGAGMALRYHFSDDKQGFFGSLSTSVEHVRSRICLNEDEVKAKTELSGTATAGNFPANSDPNGGLSVPGQQMNEAGTPLPTATDPKGSINKAYINNATGITNSGTFFPTEQSGLTNQGTAAPKNVTEAFAQSAWKYGKIDCEQKITRLADIELAIGYQWLCSDCASTSWYAGVVIPTGNKPCADYVAPAVVGNGQHGGIMMGSTFDLMLSENEDRTMWFRMDSNCRYLFRNTQKRSFDLKGNEWSRYMMVWADQEAYEAAITAAHATNDVANVAVANRNYTPGINVFTHDMKVKPRFQTRINSAVNFNSECFRAELGWNLLARTKECVEFSCPWTQKPAFADSSYVSGLALNNNRTIYNDSQGTSVNASTNNLRTDNTAGGILTLDQVSTNSATAKAHYTDFVITDADVNLDSAATPASITHTPYASLGYAWDSDCKPVVSVGAQYEFSAGNVALNKWMVWGKFEFAF